MSVPQPIGNWWHGDKKKHLWGSAFAPNDQMWNINLLKKKFCPSDAESFPNSKMVLPFEFCPKSADWEGFMFSLLKMDDFPLSGVCAPGTP